MRLKGLFHKGKHRGVYDWRIQLKCPPHGTRPVRQVHINMVTGERWMEQIQCNTEPVFLGHLSRPAVHHPLLSREVTDVYLPARIGDE